MNWIFSAYNWSGKDIPMFVSSELFNRGLRTVNFLSKWAYIAHNIATFVQTVGEAFYFHQGDLNHFPEVQTQYAGQFAQVQNFVRATLDDEGVRIFVVAKQKEKIGSFYTLDLRNIRAISIQPSILVSLPRDFSDEGSATLETKKLRTSLKIDLLAANSRFTAQERLWQLALCVTSVSCLIFGLHTFLNRLILIAINSIACRTFCHFRDQSVIQNLSPEEQNLLITQLQEEYEKKRLMRESFISRISFNPSGFWDFAKSADFWELAKNANFAFRASTVDSLGRSWLDRGWGSKYHKLQMARCKQAERSQI